MWKCSDSVLQAPDSKLLTRVARYDSTLFRLLFPSVALTPPPPYMVGQLGRKRALGPSSRLPSPSNSKPSDSADREPLANPVNPRIPEIDRACPSQQSTDISSVCMVQVEEQWQVVRRMGWWRKMRKTFNEQ
jgi:hypothetical protein